MAVEVHAFDPVSQDAANVVLDVSSSTANYDIIECDYPTPAIDSRYAEPVDTDGDILVASRYKNRQIKLKIGVHGTTAALTNTALYNLEAKLSKLAREGGTYQRTFMSGQVIFFDILEATGDPTFDITYSTGNYCEVEVNLVAKPFWRMAEVAGTQRQEFTLPWLIFTEPTIAGDVPALGRLVISETQIINQAWAMFGIQSRYYDASADAALFFQAESRTAMGTAAIATLAGASGGGSNNVLLEGSLTPNWGAVMSTQASGGGNHHTHVGTFRVIARIERPATNTGTVSIALDWAVGDFFNFTRNDILQFDPLDRAGSLMQVDLGLVTIPKALVGAQRWEGRIVAKSTVAGDDLVIDCYALVPVSECSGEARAIVRPPAVGTYSARDEFDQTTGALSGKALPIGGSWTGAGDTDDFTIDAVNHVLQRTAVSDASGIGRYAIAGATTLVNTVVQCMFPGQVKAAFQGVFARYIDTNNYILAGITGQDPPGHGLFRFGAINIKVAGTIIYHALISSGSGVQMIVDANGSWTVNLLAPDGVTIIETYTGSNAALATGGALASGKYGVYDEYTSATAGTRQSDSFAAYTYVSDAVAYASQQCQFRHDGAIRQAATGTTTAPLSDYEGDRVLIPCSGRENRTVRVITKVSRNDLTGVDTNIDDVTAQLFWTPRGLQVPA